MCNEDERKKNRRRGDTKESEQSAETIDWARAWGDFGANPRDQHELDWVVLITCPEKEKKNEWGVRLLCHSAPSPLRFYILFSSPSLFFLPPLSLLPTPLTVTSTTAYVTSSSASVPLSSCKPNGVCSYVRLRGGEEGEERSEERRERSQE